MKRKAIRALIIGTVVASSVTLGANGEVAKANEKKASEGITSERNINSEEKNYGGFDRGDMSGGDAALGLDKEDTPKSYQNSESKSTATINGIKISKQLIDINYTKGETITPKYIVIHDTDNRRAGADAQANRDYFANHPNANASAHYIIDQGNIVQALEDTWKGWHVGDGGTSAQINNSNTIGIELAVNAGNDFNKTLDNGVALTKYLMTKYNIPAENIVMHKHASGKTCSRMMIEDEPELWTSFKEKVAKGMTGEAKIIDGKNPISTGSLVNVSGYINIRAKADPYSTVVSKLHKNGKVKIYGEENGFYKVSYMEQKKGYGYINKDYVKINSEAETPEEPDTKPDVPSVEIKTGKVINVTSSLNVRSGAGTGYSSIGSLKANQTVKITGESGNWFKIDFNGKAGYVSKDFIEITNETMKPDVPDTEKPIVTEKPGQVTGITSSLNVRAGAGTTFSIIGSLRPSQVVKITGESGSWYKINFNEKVGYVSKDYVKVVNSDIEEPEPSKPDVPSASKQGKVTGISTSLNVRFGAGTNNTIIGSLKPNQTVTITGESGSWYKIDFNGKVGYVSKQYITITAEGNNTDGGNNSAPSTIVGTVFDITTKLNIRSSASTSGSIIGYLYNGNKVNITGETGNWYKIDVNGKAGYVSKDFVRK